MIKLYRGRVSKFIDLHNRFQMVAVTRVHTYPDKLRFQKFPLWRPFSKVYGYGRRFHRISVDAKRNRN